MSSILRKSATGLGVLGVVALGVMAAGTSSWASSVATQKAPAAAIEWIGPDAAPAAFEGFVAGFEQPLPAGVDWPASLPNNLLEDDVKMEKEVPLAVASFYWLCAWEDTYLNQVGNGDVKGSQSSLEMIDKFVELPFYKKHFDDPEGIWYAAVIGAAKAGDPSGIKSNFADCSFYVESNR